MRWLLLFRFNSRNRNFRLYLSNKYGKSARFRVSPLDIFSLALLERGGHPSEECGGEFHQKIFTSSLITSVEVDGSESLLNFQDSSSSRSRALVLIVVQILSVDREGGGAVGSGVPRLADAAQDWVAEEGV